MTYVRTLAALGVLLWRTKYLRNFAAFSVSFCVLTLSCLLLWPTSTAAEGHAKTNATSSSIANSAPESGGNSPSAKVIAGIQGGQAVGPGVIYAPRDVVDMTRLVLEASRDQTGHLAHYIEHATTVIVVFFSLLGAVGAAFGLHKLHDIERVAKDGVAKFESDLEKSRSSTVELEAGFKLSVENAIKDLRRETSDQVELLLAKLEIQGANGDRRTLTSAVHRIKPVLERNQVSKKARIRALADYAFALKRLGRYQEAYDSGVAAIELAKAEEPALVGFLAFNVACYAGLLENNPDAIRWLTEAIQKNPDYKEKAKTEVDFDKIKHLPDFVALIS